ncbi:hypothetical protein [Streptomyces melanogenes]|uniref:hypothetical protein n=1 Tax=Streptomyces melanogenes TaxID=67326 RepID=UPI003789BBFC
MPEPSRSPAAPAGQRPGAERLAAYDELAASAGELLADFQTEANGYRLPAEDGTDPEGAAIDPAQYTAYDEMRADYGEMALALVETLASQEGACT